MGLKRDTGYLDGLRTLAAYWVLIAHCFIWSGHPPWFPNPKLAVCIFMVLSGYVMAYGASDEPERGEWRRFYLRRFFRIAPLYYLVLATVALSPWYMAGYRAWGAPLGHYYTTDYSPANLALHTSFLFGFSNHAAVSTGLPDWSLALEMQFYAVFPLIWMAIRRWRADMVAVALALLAAPIWAILRDTFPDPSFLPLQINYFLAGILLSEARKRPQFAALAVALTFYEVGRYGVWLVTVPGVCAAIALIDGGRLDALRKLISAQWAKRGADLSYGVYLLHGFFIAAAGFFHPPLWLLIPFVLAGATASSWALNAAVEKPAIRFGRQLTALTSSTR